MDKLKNENSLNEGRHEPYALTIEEAARNARVSRSTIYLALQSGKLAARKVGRRTIIRPDDLRLFLEGLPPFLGKRAGGGA